MNEGVTDMCNLSSGIEARGNMMINDVKLMLDTVDDIDNKYYNIHKDNGDLFNIFSILGVGYKEEKICKILAELINPKSNNHSLGEVFLKIFFEKILNLDISFDELRNANVYTEYATDKSRRIDIAIITATYFIVIEAKIYAQDQEKQCIDYYEYASKYNKKTIVYYLTLDKHEPSEESKGKLKVDKNLFLISFADEIIKWLSSCLAAPEINKAVRVREIVIQLLNTIRELTGKMENNELNEIVREIGKSSSSYKAAKLIADNMSLVKVELVKRVFSAIESRFTKDFCEKYHLEYFKVPCKLEKDNYYLCAANKWCENREKKVFPNIIYRCLDNNGKTIVFNEKLELRFFIELDWRLYAGFYIYDIEKEESASSSIVNDIVKADYFSENFKMEEVNDTSWVNYIKYNDSCIDIENMNEEAMCLLDEDKFSVQIESFMKQIENILKFLK